MPNGSGRKDDRRHISQAGVHYERAYQIVQGSNNRLLRGTILSNLGYCAAEIGNAQEAIEKYAEALEIFRELREMRWITVTLADSSFPLIALNDLETASGNLHEALKLAQQYQLTGDGIQALVAVALLLELKHKREAALAIVAHVLEDTRIRENERKHCETLTRTLADILDDSSYAAAQFHGRSTPYGMMLDEAIQTLLSTQ